MWKVAKGSPPPSVGAGGVPAGGAAGGAPGGGAAGGAAGGAFGSVTGSAIRSFLHVPREPPGCACVGLRVHHSRAPDLRGDRALAEHAAGARAHRTMPRTVPVRASRGR
ncbi:MAG TPA: hypothetical protein ENK57_11940 [Polyangiaceae bacterium]|nr:hypothetical protein [Polyangiaceae bacterium]